MVPVGWLAADFVRANGYTPDSVGWGDENVEFYHRLEHVGREVKGWHRTPECRQAVSANVEWPEMSDEEALSWSQRYFGHKASGPWFVPYRSDCRSFERYDKSSDFLAPSQQERDHVLWHRVRVLPRVHRAERVEPRQGRCAVQSTWGRVLWIKYQTLDGLTRLARTGSCSGLPVVHLAPGHLWGMRADRLLYRVGSQPGVSGTTRWPFSNCGTAVNTSASHGRRSISTSMIRRFGTAAAKCAFIIVARWP